MSKNYIELAVNLELDLLKDMKKIEKIHSKEFERGVFDLVMRLQNVETRILEQDSKKNVRRLEPRPETQPFVNPEESVFPGYIICLEDGSHRKMLRRYLRTRYNMTFEEYKKKWKLPPDYPAIAPNLKVMRTTIAKKSNLGHSRY